jgi:hypothetical protein
VTVRDAFATAFRRFWRYLGILSLQVLFAGAIPAVGMFVVFFIIGIVSVAAKASAGGATFAVLMVFVALGAILVLGLIALWVWLRFSLAFPASMAEDRKVWDSMKRSNQLSKGTRGRIFVMYPLITILTVIVTYAMVIPVDLALGLKVQKIFVAGNAAAAIPLAVRIANLVISFLVRTFVFPVSVIALVLFYNDQRTRNEGYDIEQLMVQAGWYSQAPAPDVADGAFESTPGVIPETNANVGTRDEQAIETEPAVVPEEKSTHGNLDGIAERHHEVSLEQPLPGVDGE